MKTLRSRSIITLLCAIIALSVFAGVLAANRNSALGAEIRKAFVTYAERVDEAAEDIGDPDVYLSELEEMDFWFPIPDGFLNTKNSGKQYVSKINPYDTPEIWVNLDIEEMFEVSQIPQESVKSLSTDDLILTCMNYNFFSDMYFFNTIKEGFENVASSYNGLQELSLRADSGSRLIDLYKSIDFDRLLTNDRSSTIRFQYLEMVLAQDSVLDTLTAQESRELAVECYNKVVQIAEGPPDTYTISTTLFLGLNCLYRHDSGFAQIIDGSAAVKTYIETGRLNLDDVSDATLGDIVSYFKAEYLGGEL